jgi:hypothetical protein
LTKTEVFIEMKKCSKCGEQKELDQYQKYWHSTQNTFRIRGYCKSCFSHQQKLVKQRLRSKKIIQPLETIPPPAPIIDYTGNKEYKLCPDCKEWKYKDQYYTNRFNVRKEERIWGRCKPCQKIYDKNKSHQEMLDNDGPQRVLVNPNSYQNDYQRDRTFEIMKAIGWKFNEEKGIWWKEGIKTEDGVFNNIREYIKPSRVFIKQEKRVLHPAFEHREEIYQMRKKGYSYLYIAREFDTSAPTINKIIRLYEESLNG